MMIPDQTPRPHKCKDNSPSTPFPCYGLSKTIDGYVHANIYTSARVLFYHSYSISHYSIYDNCVHYESLHICVWLHYGSLSMVPYPVVSFLYEIWVSAIPWETHGDTHWFLPFQRAHGTYKRRIIVRTQRFSTSGHKLFAVGGHSIRIAYGLERPVRQKVPWNLGPVRNDCFQKVPPRSKCRLWHLLIRDCCGCRRDILSRRWSLDSKASILFRKYQALFGDIFVDDDFTPMTHREWIMPPFHPELVRLRYRYVRHLQTKPMVLPDATSQFTADCVWSIPAETSLRSRDYEREQCLESVPFAIFSIVCSHWQWSQIISEFKNTVGKFKTLFQQVNTNAY